MTLHTISYGGGVQSTAMIVLAVNGHIPNVDCALFANVGDDSEHPATLRFVADIMTPWCNAHGFTIHELRHHRWTVYRKATETHGGVIPLRGANGAPMKRGCTSDFKVGVIERWLKAHGATVDTPAVSLIGISTDEMHRAGKPQQPGSVQIRRYPLLELGLNRSDCEQVIRDAGLAVPPKSACYFCPYHRPQVWAEMRRDEPDVFAAAVAFERRIHVKMAERGRDPLYLAPYGKPLDEAIAEAQPSLFPVGIGEDGCDEGVCWV